MPSMNSHSPDLHGVFPMLVTPFDAYGSVLWDDLERLIEWVLASGVHGIAALGLVGESSRLTEEERQRVAQRVLRVVGGRAPVIIGVSAQDTVTACQLANAATRDGARAVMVAPPAVSGITRDQLWAHYREVAVAADEARVMVQDAPTFLGVALDAKFISDLTRACPNVRYVKSEAVPSGEKTAELTRMLGPGIGVFGGMGGLNCLEVLDAGAKGFIPGCELGREWVTLFEAHDSGCQQEAEKIYQRVLPLIAFMYQSLDFGIACGKELAKREGIISSAALRSPYILSRWSSAVLERHAERARIA
jgi:4-hydroxy-tetrahydrodipicolinate synthase